MLGMLKRTNLDYLHLVVTSKNYIGSTKQIFLVENEETRGGALSCIHKVEIYIYAISVTLDINKVLVRNLVLVKQRYLGLWIEL
ncbi:unnamed protein product [Acanthoscelides obtectus]|uniref:Uncharacterized protein n=1 Tax=Acanthoscelides obtectus TaxID=200917 RepID=A0A9P0MAJ1_ACAOB|nr:unnamed protein product [Acanthoscelides obtectus]CAK1682777.1 hypothetical protein AOBTE_LOCUS33872 [Acanthoscelides obtectus]